MRIGMVGIGFMGWIHKLAYDRVDGATLTAFASRSAARRGGDWSSISGNFGPPGEVIDVSNLAAYESIDGLIADDNVDLIDVCLPPHLHGEAIRKSIAAGKKVFCEKPLALTADEALELATLGEPGQLFVAHILPFMGPYRWLVDAAQDKRVGNLQSMRLKRFIAPPDWNPDFYDPARVGGPLVDLHVHDAHLIRMLMGIPDHCHTAGTDKGSVRRNYETLFTYDDGRFVSSGGGVINAPGRSFTHGFEATFENAVAQYEFAAYGDGSTADIGLLVLHQDGRIERPNISDSDPIVSFASEIAALVESIETGTVHPALDPMIAADALRICEMQ